MSLVAARRAAHLIELILIEKRAIAKCRLQIVEPRRLGIVFREEGALYPIRVTALNEAEHEDLLAADLGHALNFDLSGAGAHRGPTHRASKPRDARHRASVDIVGARERHLEIMLRAGISLDEHIIRDEAKPDLLTPHLGPNIRVIVDIADERGLGADHDTRAAESADRLADDRRRHLTRVVEMSHEGHVLTALNQPLKEAEEIIGVIVGDEALRPITKRFRADTDGLEMLKARIEQGQEVVLEMPRLHHKRITARKKEIRDILIAREIAMELAGFIAREAELLIADELRPAEAEGAIAMTGLTRAREKEHGLA